MCWLFRSITKSYRKKTFSEVKTNRKSLKRTTSYIQVKTTKKKKTDETSEDDDEVPYESEDTETFSDLHDQC